VGTIATHGPLSWRDASVLITGGTGSFGHKFVETMLTTYHPRRLVVLSRDELKQSEMMARFKDESLRFFVGDVRDRDRLERAMHGIDMVFHAAALKQIPSCEYNPFEAIQTNVIGAENVISAAIDQGVKRVIAISTDKAVNPVNLYGATKLCAEKLFVQGNAYGYGRGTVFGVVRYGNVIGSRGSVIPIFAAQRDSGCGLRSGARRSCMAARFSCRRSPACGSWTWWRRWRRGAGSSSSASGPGRSSTRS